MEARSAATSVNDTPISASARQEIPEITMALVALLIAPAAAAGKQLKVIGAGMGRTGTDSLRTALNELGFKTYHMCELLGICNEGGTRAPSPLEMLGFEGGHNELWADVNRNISAGVEPDFSFLTEEFDAAVDFPSAAFWPELLKANPKAKVVLTVRDPHKLHNSITNAWCHIIGAGTLLDQAVTEITFNRPWGRWNRAMQIEWGKATGRLVGVPGFTWVQACNDEAYAVAAFKAWDAKVKATVPADQLLIFETGKHGYTELAAFLGVKEPTTPYPHTNSTAEFTFVLFIFRFLALLTVGVPTLLACCCLRRGRGGAKPKTKRG